MEQRISIVTLGVKDLATSKRFYADGLGWKPAFNPAWPVKPDGSIEFR